MQQMRVEARGMVMQHHSGIEVKSYSIDGDDQNVLISQSTYNTTAFSLIYHAVIFVFDLFSS